MKRLWLIVVVACLFVAWARYPAQSNDCGMVRGYVQQHGIRTVREVALSLGYTLLQMRQFRLHCARMGIRF